MTAPGMFDDAPVPIEAQIDEVEREIEMRRVVYGRRVQAGQMAQSASDQRIAGMRAVLATLQRVKREQDDGK